MPNKEVNQCKYKKVTISNKKTCFDKSFENNKT